jgi:alkanesulfonate monooxygenase SsuD/methylene tetrahydromethanopterin reductase-like flavin-dependent oxidoreductase (luciferase family)
MSAMALPMALPALSLAAVPGRRRATIDLAVEIERRGFAGIYGPSLGDSLSLCLAIALETERIPFGTTITPIYTRHVADFAQTVAFLHEVSGGRFRFGIGVSHETLHRRLGLEVGKPLEDVRRFVAELRAIERVGELPPILVAGLRDRMVALACEIAEGVVFANAARSHFPHSAGILAANGAQEGFFVGNMIPTVVSDDLAAARTRHRRTLASYVLLPNYRNYWREAGFVEEMDGIEAALDRGDYDNAARFMSDAWLDQVTLSGSAARVREGVEAWREAGVTTPILVPSSASGNQMDAFEEVFAAFE